MDKPYYFIKDWLLIKMGTKKYLRGTISNGLGSSREIFTNEIIHLDLENNQAETRTHKYKLAFKPTSLPKENLSYEGH